MKTFEKSIATAMDLNQDITILPFLKELNFINSNVIAI